MPALESRRRPRAAAERRRIGEGGLPQFAEERGWLELPAKWRLGNTSAVSADAEGHVWVLHRPRTLPAELRALAAPPVLEFDSAGNLLPRVGAARPPAMSQPNEHGLHVRPKRLRVDCRQCDAAGRPDSQVHEGRKARDANRQERTDRRQHHAVSARGRRDCACIQKGTSCSCRMDTATAV